MIVRDDGSAWQVVMQPDHAALAGELAGAWGGSDGFAAPRRRESVIRACAHHDDGWLAWERMARVDEDGVPMSFLKVEAGYQMDFYRGVIATLDDVDPYAGLLTSMHACGLYGEDLGWTMHPVPAAHRDDAARFLAHYAPQRAARIHASGADPAEVQHDYDLLQVVDRLSLHLCMRGDGESQTIQRIVGADGTMSTLRVRAVAPGVLALDHFPFAGDELEVDLWRRELPKRRLRDDGELAEALAATAPHPRRVRFIPEPGTAPR